MDALIDSLTGDYTGTRTTDLHNAVYLRLMTPLGQYWADPQLGSRLHELARAKDSATTRRLAQQYAEQALQPLLDDNRARRIDVSVSRPAQGDLRLHIDFEAANGNLQTFTHPVKVI
ncbi:phage GP46 family protein [Sodalis endosymbiont of Spalangia cameroni]|uniref:phage GP46 family protein n=1 Tax=Sodalis praecaptivus TaxID=1239307 RepID=UPI0031F8B559